MNRAEIVQAVIAGTHQIECDIVYFRYRLLNVVEVDAPRLIGSRVKASATTLLEEFDDAVVVDEQNGKLIIKAKGAK